MKPRDGRQSTRIDFTSELLFPICKNIYVKKKRKKKCQIGTGVPVHIQHVPVHVMQKGAEANMYQYTTNLYRYMRSGFEPKGFLTPFFISFDIHNLSIL